MELSSNWKLKDMFPIELIRDVICSVFLRTNSVQIYGGEIFQVKILRAIYMRQKGALLLSLSLSVMLCPATQTESHFCDCAVRIANKYSLPEKRKEYENTNGKGKMTCCVVAFFRSFKMVCFSPKDSSLAFMLVYFFLTQIQSSQEIPKTRSKIRHFQNFLLFNQSI